jgi:chloramphenicol 3-O-phosphotransferase
VTSRPEPALIVLTGIMAAGKSTVAQLVAERLPRAAHVRGDAFRRMVVSGRAEPGPELTPAAAGQLRLRYELTALVADGYADAGFTAVVQDIVFGPELPVHLDRFRTRPRHLVVLAPRPDAVADREAGRAKTGYAGWTPHDLDAALRRDTPRLGLWLDSSDLTPAQTADAILARLPESRLDRPAAPGH